MQVRGTDITVHRGEMFSMDYLLVNRNGAPYIFPKSSSVKNPHFLLTIASTKYLQDGRYLKNYWLKIPEDMRFVNTNPNDAVAEPNGVPGNADAKDYIYYKIVDGKKKYRRWTGKEFVDYEFRFTKTFTTPETLQWTAQSYVYSINYVDGELMLDYLTELYKQNISLEDVPTSKYDLYTALVKFDDKYSSIEYERELHDTPISIPIVTPSKLSVIDEVQGGLKYGD